MIPLMSFWPSIYAQIEGQIKLIEYRRAFPVDCSFAYMYITSPVQAICGIVYFGNMYSIADWKAQYTHDVEVLSRIDAFKPSTKFGMEISGFQKTLPITLEELRENVPNFTPPQSYLLLDRNKILSDYIENHIVHTGERIKNELKDIFPEHICKKY